MAIATDKDRMAARVGELLAKRAELARVNLELPPAERMELQRLLYRLGWTRKLSRGAAMQSRLPHFRLKYALKLGPGVPSRHASGEQLFTHPYTDDAGNRLGVVRVIPRNDGRSLHVDWAGPEDVKPGGVANTLGHAAVRSLRDQLTAMYPQAKFLTGIRAGGARKANPERTVVGIPGRYAANGEFEKRNEKAKKEAKKSFLPHVRDGAHICNNCNARFYTTPDGGKCPKCGGKMLVARGKMQQAGKPRRYGKVDHDVPAHPLVASFPIEHALRRLANDPKNSSNVRDLAALALTGKAKNEPAPRPEGHPEALWALHDALRDEGHPAAEWYNWMSAGDKVLTDRHTQTALEELAHQHRVAMAGRELQEPDGNGGMRYQFRYTPEAKADRLGMMIRSGHDFGPTNERITREQLDYVRSRVKQLAPHLADKDVDESVLRHAARAKRVWAQRYMPSRSEELNERSVGPHAPNLYNAPEEKAARYAKKRRYAKQTLRTDFIQALRRARASNNDALKRVAAVVGQRLGFRKLDLVDALHDTPHGAVPGVAAAVYGTAKPEALHAGAAWLGLTGNLPGVAVFHVRQGGPDHLWRMRQEGSGLDIRARLDRFGLVNRVLIPHRSGFDIIIADVGTKLGSAVRAYAKHFGLQLQGTAGFFKPVGSTDQASAREMFRDKVVAGERTSGLQKFAKRYNIPGAKGTPGGRKMGTLIGPVRYSHKAFLDKIGNNERDVNHRAVYADWIEENDPQSATPGVLDRLRNYKGRMFVGMSPGGKVLAIPTVSKEWIEENAGPWGMPSGNVYHRTSTNSKGRAHGVRFSGRMKTWKTRPGEYRIPWKFGLYDNGEITHQNEHQFLIEDPTDEPQV